MSLGRPKTWRWTTPWHGIMVVLLCALTPFDAAAAPPGEEAGAIASKPPRLEGVDLKERLKSRLPLNLSFVDSQGKAVTLADYFQGARPVVLTFNYSNCPMLCSLQLNGFVTALKQLSWTAGEEFEIVTISLDPDETPERAARTKARYLGDYGRPGAESGWHFLTGGEQSIQAAADAVGFEYNYNEARDEYIHPAVLTLLSPSGVVVRYLYGLEYPEDTLRLALVESSEGKIGSSVDRLILYCFHYDETEGRYAPVAMNIMRVGGGLTALALGAFLGAYWLRQWRGRRSTRKASGSATSFPATGYSTATGPGAQRTPNPASGT